MKMTARALAAALDGDAAGFNRWLARCPTHPDRTPSLSITERGGIVLLICRAGCAQNRVIDALKRRGLWGGGRAAQPQVDEPAPVVEVRPRRDPLRAWRDGYDIRNTLAEVYFAHRGIVLTDVEAEALRFRPHAYHWPSAQWLPSIVAWVRRANGKPLTCHETFIDPSGRGKAQVEKPRLIPAQTSILAGGVWFGRLEPGSLAVVAEGIESAMSAMRLTGATAGVAALSARNLQSLLLPEEAQRITVYADNDEPGLQAAWSRARYWKAEGRSVEVVTSDRDDEDANDVLRRRASFGP